jgi:serine/threonine protein phosphatase PrpC
MVADGMGGHARGKDASSTAIQVANGIIVKELLLPLLAGGGADTIDRPIQEVLIEATAAANEAVSRIDEEAGTTLTSVLIVDHSAHIAHVGDTRVYHLSAGDLRQITQDHSLVSRLVELGQISPQEAPEHPQRNFLYRAVGQGPELKVDTHFQRVTEGSYLVLCSDGLWNEVTEIEIVETISDSSCAQEACDRLIDKANENGGEDNITLLLARVNY